MSQPFTTRIQVEVNEVKDLRASRELAHGGQRGSRGEAQS